MISEQLPRTAPDEFVIGAASGQEGVPRDAMTLWIGRSSFTIGTARTARDAMVGDGTFSCAMRLCASPQMRPEARFISIDAEAVKKFSDGFFL